MNDMLRTEHEHRSADAPKACGLTMLAPAISAADLRRTIDSHVIPRVRLALAEVVQAANHPLVAVKTRCAATPLSDDEINLLADRLVAGDRNGCLDQIDALVATGVPLERIFIELLGSTACRLDRLHAEDVLGLAEASLAFCDLQGLLRHYSQSFRGEAGVVDTGLRALLAAPPRTTGSLPVFGLLLLSEFFRRDGWDARIEPDMSGAMFSAAVLTEWFDLVEMVASRDEDLDSVAAAIKAIRRGSPNRAIGVIVCGDVFRQHPEFVRLVGADLMASDPLSSLAQAKHFISHQTPRQRLA